MPFSERGPVRIRYEEVGSGFPLLLIPGGGLNSSFQSWETASPFKPMEKYKNDFRCICADLRNANPGQSSGPLEIDRCGMLLAAVAAWLLSGRCLRSGRLCYGDGNCGIGSWAASV